MILGWATAKSSKKTRPLLGRKGIGQFAGFGIAQRMVVETISAQTGNERFSTSALLNLDRYA
jgi:hypothetical protein